ncbi:gelsolin-like protein 1 [Convolutriloba macropyga]|uniref:gelsolin-like protein 1 n=1 Tax=Convolutriloba macropyga TaxID=536237 RepID=UPI003F51AD29
MTTVIEKAFVDAGKKEGMEIWRIEKKEVKPWPKERYGEFFNGDSYIVLSTKKEKSGRLEYDLHFWIGKESSQDEYGAVAVKAVELDQMLGDVPVQHREIQDHESKLFKSYFDELIIKQGGVDSGFVHVEAKEYKPRLLRFRIEKGKFVMSEVQCKRANLDSGDVFILDNGLDIHQWNGKSASGMEKMKATQFVSKLKSERGGKPKVEVHDEVDMRPGDEFYDRCFPISGPRDQPDQAVWSKVKSLYRVSDASGKPTFTKEKEGKVALKDMSNTGDVFVFDAMHTIYVFKSKGCSLAERLSAIKFGDKYIEDNGLKYVPMTVIDEEKAAKNEGFMGSLD